MKFMIASDIHGSAYYCEKMLEAFTREGAEKLLLLGDILYHGPRNNLPKNYDPKAVIAMLNPLASKILCVRGNCDSEVDQMVLEFPIMAENCILHGGRRTIFATHGHHYTEKNPPALSGGAILLTGHTHIAACTQHDTFTYCNPGSISLPKGDAPYHGYMLLADDTLTWKDLDGNVKNSF